MHVIYAYTQIYGGRSIFGKTIFGGRKKTISRLCMDWKRAGTVKFEAHFSSSIDLNLNMMKSICRYFPNSVARIEISRCKNNIRHILTVNAMQEWPTPVAPLVITN